MRRIMVLVLAVFALAACSKQAPEVAVNDQVPASERTEAASTSSEPAGAGTDEGGAQPVWVAKDIEFTDAPAELPAGETTVTLQNTGAALHNVTIDGETVVEAQPGATAEGSINLEPGTHEYICSVPGHEGSMNGKLEVK